MELSPTLRNSFLTIGAIGALSLTSCTAHQTNTNSGSTHVESSATMISLRETSTLPSIYPDYALTPEQPTTSIDTNLNSIPYSTPSRPNTRLSTSEPDTHVDTPSVDTYGHTTSSPSTQSVVTSTGTPVPPQTNTRQYVEPAYSCEDISVTSDQSNEVLVAVEAKTFNAPEPDKITIDFGDGTSLTQSSSAFVTKINDSGLGMYETNNIRHTYASQDKLYHIIGTVTAGINNYTSNNCQLDFVITPAKTK